MIHNNSYKKREQASNIKQVLNSLPQNFENIRINMDRLFKERISNIDWWHKMPITLWDIKTLFAPPYNKQLNKLLDYSNIVSSSLSCHPALGLACLLCDLPLYPLNFPKLEITRANQNIQLYINSLEIPRRHWPTYID